MAYLQMITAKFTIYDLCPFFAHANFCRSTKEKGVAAQVFPCLIRFAIKYFIMVQSTDFESCRFGSILVEDIIGICQKEHPKFKVLQCSTKPYWHGLWLKIP